MLDADDVEIEELQGLLQDIADDGHRAGEVIRRLRDFLRRRAAATGPFEINPAVHEVCDMLHAAIERRRVDLTIDLAPDMPQVVGDRVQIQQVVLNLIMNAVEAIDALGDHHALRALHVVSRHTADAVRISVRDSGVGMGDDPAKAFDPFYSTKTNGLGVGLTISRTIIEGHGGKLWCAPGPDGRGTEFHFELPLA
jgi:signal transduction histidine kinase